jgi:23S rRNA pseudouridine2605 synthase
MANRHDDRPEGESHPRLQKVLASAGYGSRRQCEALIVEGRVEVDGQPARQLGTRVDPARQRIRVDGDEIKSPRRKYFMLHKPVGVISTARDPWARTRVIDLVEDPDRLFTIGRLDKSSSGLILVTNDGDLAQRLTHPSYGVQKVYRVVVAGKPTVQSLQQLRRGIHLAEGRARVQRVTLKRAHAKQSVLEIVLTEGRNREIRRLLARVGHKVQQLKRVAIGPVKLGELPVGAYRELEPYELSQLRQAAAAAHRPGTRRAAARQRGQQ